VDDLHLIEADIVPLKRTLNDIARALSPDDEVAVVYVGRSDLSLNFTTDSGRLFRAIENVREAVGFGLDALPADPRYVLNQASLRSCHFSRRPRAAFPRPTPCASSGAPSGALVTTWS
jgi:hypothetical protein